MKTINESHLLFIDEKGFYECLILRFPVDYWFAPSWTLCFINSTNFALSFNVEEMDFTEGVCEIVEERKKDSV